MHETRIRVRLGTLLKCTHFGHSRWNNNKSESELSDGSESPKTDSEIIDDFLEYEKVENEKKVTKSSKKKNAKLKKEKERKDIKKEKDKAYNELILMRCEDIRLIQKRREEIS